MTASEYRRRYGVYLPHFGPGVSGEALVRGAREAERYGFDSVWVRDHLIYHPHPQDPQDPTHVEPLTVLTMAGAVTERLILGAGSLIPYRHPIYMAIQYAALSFFVGDRIIIGFGAGNYDHEFEAVGLGGIDRVELVREQVEIIRKLWTGESVSHHGPVYNFDNVDVHPVPRAPIPIWNCGNSAAAARRAVEFCDGLLPSRMTRTTFAKRMARMRRLSGEAGRGVPEAGVVSLASPGKTLEEGLRHVNVAGLVAEQQRALERGVAAAPASGAFATFEDLEGIVVAGPADGIAEQVVKFHEAGVSHFVFDLRFRYRDWFECLDVLGRDVLPLLRGGAGSA